MNKDALKIAIGFFMGTVLIILSISGLVLFLHKLFSPGWVIILFMLMIITLLSICVYFVEAENNNRQLEE